LKESSIIDYQEMPKEINENEVPEQMPIEK
jgi:hypothetical protein